MKKLILLILTVFLLGGVVYFLWATTPEYSFLKIRNAVKTNNLEVGMKYIDVDSIFENLWQKDIQNLISSNNNAELEKLGILFGVLVNDDSKALIKEEMGRGIEKWFFPSSEQADEEGTMSLGVLSEKEDFKIRFVKDDNAVYIQQPNNIKIVFSKKPGELYWVITEIEGLLQLMSRSNQ